MWSQFRNSESSAEVQTASRGLGRRRVYRRNSRHTCERGCLCTHHRDSTLRAPVTAVIVLAASIAALLVPASPSGAVSDRSDIEVTRYGGPDRYATSLRVAEAVAGEVDGRLDQVVMVPGRRWTDAVIAAPLAGALGAPVLTTPSDELRSDAASFLRRTRVSRVLLVGANSDTQGIGPSVVAELEALGIAVERVTRPDQYATSVAAARRLGTPGRMEGHGRTAIVASGEVFADALVAGPLAARGRHPILLTKPHVLRRDVARYLTENSVEHVVLMGGTGALREAIEESIAALGIEVTRVAGATRYETAAEAAALAVRRYSLTCFTQRRVALARGDIPFDSFSAAPLLARLCTPLLLTDPDDVPAPTARYLNQARTDIGAFSGVELSVHVFGGNAAVSNAAINAYLAVGTASSIKCGLQLGREPRPILDDVEAILPAWSPDCRRIAYVSNGAIWISDSNGRQRVELTNGTYPTWSPDGSRVAFTRFTGRVRHDEYVAHIYTIRVDGGDEVQLTDSTAQDVAPRWSPDGDRILFRRKDLSSPPDPDDLFGNRHLAIIGADGSNETRVDASAFFEQAHYWTHDGERISIMDGGGVATVRDDGSDWRPVWAVALSDIRFSEYAWSPDGCRIALVDTVPVEDDLWMSYIMVLNLEDDSVSSVVHYVDDLVELPRIRMPAWAPDGQSIAFVLDDWTVGPHLHGPIYVAKVPPP